MNLPYNWTLWDGSRFDFKTTIAVDEGYVQDPVSISYYPDTLKAVTTQYATVVLGASGGLRTWFVHENNYALAPYAFAWTKTPAAPTLEWTSYGGYEFKAIDWFLAGKMSQGQPVASNVLDVDEAIQKMLNAVDLNDDGTLDTAKEKKLKEYIESKRLQLGETYYFHLIRYGGNALFETSGYHAGPWNNPATPPTNFVNSAVASSTPIKMPRQEDDKLKKEATENANMAEYYFFGQKDFPTDYFLAFKYALKGAHGGNATAQFRVAWMYDTGLGIEPDPVEAHRWYRVSAEQGNALASFNLGNFYNSGIGSISKDLNLAFYYYKKAADLGVHAAEYCIGECYYFGNGTDKNTEAATKYYAKAINYYQAKFDNGTATEGELYCELPVKNPTH
jgi:TPR repeat protein